eukprot:IDg1409t1
MRKLFQCYENEWESFASGLLSAVPRITQMTKPVYYSMFTRYWKQYMPLLRIAATGSDFCDTSRHAIQYNFIQEFHFNFAEKVLLPRLKKQPGQIHFITGLKFDCFRVASRNSGTKDMCGLVE